MLPGPDQIIACPNCQCERGTMASCAIRRRGSWVSAGMNGVGDTPGHKRRTHPVVQPAGEAAVAAKAGLKHFRGTTSDPAPSGSPNTCRPDCGMDGGFDQPDVTRRARR